MTQLIFTESASDDQSSILNDLNKKAGVLTAFKFQSLFRSLYDRLVDYPDSGAPRPALGPDIRIGIVSPQIIIYSHSVDDDTVTVLRLVHARRRITGKLLAG